MDPDTDPMPPGRRIKMYRRRRGLTQDAAAALIGKSVGCWRKWESGERSPGSLADWLEIARVLGVRDLERLTGLPMGLLPDDPAEHESVPALRAAMLAYRPTVDPPDAAELRTAVHLAWATWHQSPHRYTHTAPVLPGLIHAARAAVAGLDGQERREAQRATADLYLLVRSYAKRVGANDLAAIAADRALTAAYETDDPAYRASAAWNLGQVLSNRGHAEQAIDVCTEAIADITSGGLPGDPVVLSTLGGLHLLTAIQHARLRDERRARDMLDAADRIAARTGDTTHHWLFFGPTNTAIHRTAAALELSRHGETIRVGERVDVTASPSVERRHSHYTHLARAYASRREDLAAITMLLRADRDVPEESRLNLLMRSIVRELLTRETPTTRADLRLLAGRVGIA
ncbi:helix-turn-helix transcriptional regulator [Micromonospora sp. NPDC006766]|uniref:helix-turn-helix transcriptional regulator n=1 Tax=Micromonospora sp. NPDC006766 TaxID=3154778 RepID=UPI0033FCF732